MSKGALPVILENRGPITLRDTDYVAAGGEATIYRSGATIIKIYSDGGKMLRDGMADKMRLLADRLKHPDIVAPQGVVLNAGRLPIGFYMPFVSGEPLSRVFVSSFRSRAGFSDRNAVTLVDRMRDVVIAAHDAQAVMVDANELNWMVGLDPGQDPAPKVIDVDSWAIGRWPATVVMPSIRDWRATRFDAASDWFGWGILAFQVFTGIHPYKGKMDGYRPGDLVQRMKDNASVFDARVRLPHSVRDFSCIPGPLLDWFEAEFQRGERNVPPSPRARAKPAKAARVARATTTSSGALIYEKLFARAGDDVLRVWHHGAALLRSGDVVDLADGRTLASGFSPNCAVALTAIGWMIADFQPGKARIVRVLDGKATTDPFTFDPRGTRNFFQAGNRLFCITERELIELQPRFLGGTPVLTPARRWTLLMNSTAWLDGVAVQDVMGSKFAFLPFGTNGVVQTRIRELDRLDIVSGWATDRFACFVGLDRKSGEYRKHEIYFDATFQKYSHWEGGCDSPDLNVAVMPSGVVATIVTDGELVLHVPANGNINRVADKQITTAMKLGAWQDRLLYVEDGAVWRIRMRQ